MGTRTNKLKEWYKRRKRGETYDVFYYSYDGKNTDIINRNIAEYNPNTGVCNIAYTAKSEKPIEYYGTYKRQKQLFAQWFGKMIYSADVKQASRGKQYCWRVNLLFLSKEIPSKTKMERIEKIINNVDVCTEEQYLRNRRKIGGY